MRMLRSKKLVAVGVAAVAVFASGVAAYAYFTSTGRGTGTATVGSATPWVVSEVATAGGPLLPGAGTQTVTYRVTNGSTGQQQLHAVVVSVAADGTGNVLNAAAVNAAVPGCRAEWFAVDNTGAPQPANLAGGAGVTGSAKVTMRDSGTSQDPCQAVSPGVVVSVT